MKSKCRQQKSAVRLIAVQQYHPQQPSHQTTTLSPHNPPPLTTSAAAFTLQSVSCYQRQISCKFQFPVSFPVSSLLFDDIAVYKHHRHLSVHVVTSSHKYATADDVYMLVFANACTVILCKRCSCVL